MTLKKIVFKVFFFVIRFFLSGYLTFLILTLTNVLPFSFDEDYFNVIQRTIVYMILAIPFLSCFYTCVLIFSPKEKLVIIQIQREREIVAFHLFRKKISILYNFVSYVSTSNLRGISSYVDITIDSRSVVQMMEKNILIKNFLTHKRKIETIFNLIIYILIYVLGYGLLSLILY